MRAVIQVAYVLRRLLLGMLRVRTTGVKVMVFNEQDAILLIRNGYGPSGMFLLPGGGVGRLENPSAAAIREVREELGLSIECPEPVAIYQSCAEGKRDTIHLFRAIARGEPRVDGIEVVEARFFDLSALPEEISPATVRRIAEWKDERAIDGSW